MHCCGHVACVGHLLLSRMPQGHHAQGQHKTYKKQIRKRIAVVNTRAELTPGQHAQARAELVRRITTEGGATRAQRLTQPVVVGETRREAGARLRASRMSSRPGTCKGRLDQEAARLTPAHSLSLSVYTTVYLLSMSRPAAWGCLHLFVLTHARSHCSCALLRVYLAHIMGAQAHRSRGRVRR